jgi:hypothetical protein
MIVIIGEEVETSDYDLLVAEMLIEARSKHGDDVGPCGGRTTWDRCVAIYGQLVTLWYNDRVNDSTHMISRRIIL